MSAEDVAHAHYAQRAALVAAAQEAAARSWTAVDPTDVASSWLAQVPAAMMWMTAAQEQAAAQADAYLVAMAATQGIEQAAVAEVVASAFAGVASDGRDLASLLVQPAFTMIAALAGERPPEVARAAGLAALQMIVGTQVADAGREPTRRP